MGTRADALADQFEQAVDDFAKVVEGCTDDQWGAVCGAEGWTIAQTAQHVSGQFPLEMEFITAPAEGKPMPAYTWDDINGKNDGRALKNTSVSKADVLKELRAGGVSTAAYIRSTQRRTARPHGGAGPGRRRGGQHATADRRRRADRPRHGASREHPRRLLSVATLSSRTRRSKPPGHAARHAHLA